mgnify:CR=1 FL=1
MIIKVTNETPKNVLEKQERKDATKKDDEKTAKRGPKKRQHNGKTNEKGDQKYVSKKTQKCDKEKETKKGSKIRPLKPVTKK